MISSLSAPEPSPATGPSSLIDRLIERHGPQHEARIRRGVAQVAERWREEDGDEAAFAAFCEESFLTDPQELTRAFERLERVLEQVDGHLLEVRRELTLPIDVDTGEVSEVDHLLSNLDLAAHVDEDLFRTRVAFLALLNFPLHTLAERLELGVSWDREAWARSRFVDRFALRMPATVRQEATRAFIAAERYISGCNLRLDRVVTPEGERLFPEGLRLITHWGLRDELASHYADASPAGLVRQRTIFRIMERIVRQEIPAAVIDNPALLWEPFSNAVRPLDAETWDSAPEPPEPDTRYARLLDVFHAVRLADPYSPGMPTFVDRRFDRDREIPEAEVEALLVSVLDSPEFRDLAREIERRVGRPLEPFDIWFSGFRPRASYSDEDLDGIVRERFPALEAFQRELPRTLEALGFTPERAGWLADRIVVDPARGAGHAMGAVRREDKAHLRTRVPRGGMDYKGYNVALHELGHNVEQVFSLNGIDFWALSGVPNTAFTEAFAFVFQHRDLELLGLETPSDETRRAGALATLWNTAEIAGVSLVDMRVWRWMYAHLEATPAELKEAALAIARGVWDRHFAPVFGCAGSDILAIYSHMIVYGLYLPDYAIGHIISFQVAERLERGDFGAEVERMTRLGRLTPDAWMRAAVGAPISARALLEASRRALDALAS